MAAGMYSGSIVEQPWTACFLSAKDPEREPAREAIQSGDSTLDNAAHVWSRIILLKYGCGQALKVRNDNWLQHLGDVALAV
ncbi:hypothetical protein TNCV_1470591 [Trichonephila clavipes]|nr:hypothetical protein TNCV_1470591 [Trichonephila clavipes]